MRRQIESIDQFYLTIQSRNRFPSMCKKSPMALLLHHNGGVQNDGGVQNAAILHDLIERREGFLHDRVDVEFSEHLFYDVRCMMYDV